MGDDNYVSENCPICHPNLLTAELWQMKTPVEEVEIPSCDDHGDDSFTDDGTANSDDSGPESNSDEENNEERSEVENTNTRNSYTVDIKHDESKTDQQPPVEIPRLKNSDNNEITTICISNEVAQTTEDDNKFKIGNTEHTDTITPIDDKTAPSKDILYIDGRMKRQIIQKPHRRNRKHRNSSGGQIITMPTGRKYWMPTPASLKFRCGNWTQLITLDKHDRRRGRREYQIIEQEMQNTIVSLQNCKASGGCFEKYDVIKIQRIVQGCVWRRYQNRKTDVELENHGNANERMLFHGTHAVRSIIKNGFDERYASTNGQFGAGLYFGDRSSLCNQFVFGYFGGSGCYKHKDKNCYICERRMLLCRVILGNVEKMSYAQNMAHPPKYKHSIEATVSPGTFLYPEYVVYRGEQVYPEYLITYKIVKPQNHKSNKDSN